MASSGFPWDLSTSPTSKAASIDSSARRRFGLLAFLLVETLAPEERPECHKGLLAARPGLLIEAADLVGGLDPASGVGRLGRHPTAGGRRRLEGEVAVVRGGASIGSFSASDWPDHRGAAGVDSPGNPPNGLPTGACGASGGLP